MTLMMQEIMQQPDILNACLDANYETIKRIAAQLNGKNINMAVIAGRGTSDHAGIYFKYLLEIFKGIPASLAAPSAITLYGAKPDMSNCLVVGISQSGRAADVLEVIRLANEQGAVTVSVTNNPLSPLAKEAMYHLYCFAGEEKSVAATKTFTSQLYLLGRLAAEWSQNSQLSASLDSAPLLVKDTLALSDVLFEKARERKDIEEIFVLSRGINYALALEAALKIQETCYVRAHAYAVSDFHHGPFAMVREGDNALLFALDDRADAYVFEMYEKLKAINARPLLFTNDNRYSDDAVILNEKATGAAGIFAGAVAAQLFACHLSQLKGLNPDKPRNLSKITVTY